MFSFIFIVIAINHKHLYKISGIFRTFQAYSELFNEPIMYVPAISPGSG